MQRPALVRRNANLPPNVSKETAFCYQTNSQPYHLNMSMGYQYMHRRREIQRQSSSCDYDDDDDAAFDVTDSEAEGEEGDDEEDEYETNIHLALENDNHYSHESYFDNQSNVDATQLDDDNDNDNDNNNDNNNNNDNDNETHDNDNDINSDNNNVNHNNNGDTTYREAVMTAERPTTSNPIVSVDNSQIDQTSHRNFSGSPSNSNESSETDPKRLTDNLGIHNQISSRRVSNEETRENEDKFDSPNIGNDLDARRRMPSLSYLLPSDDIIISDENENESENSDTENGDNNTLIICQENGP